MIRVAVVGDIGSGKSYVAKQLGWPVFNADVAVIQLYKKNKKCFKKLKKTFPKYIFSFPIRRKELSKAVMENTNNIKKINKIVHPEVRLRMKKFIKKNKKKKVVVMDIPLLLENKINKKKDIIIFVEAKRKATFEANDKTYQGVASLWDIAGVTPASKLTDKIERYMDRFIRDYVKAKSIQQ